MKPRRLSTVPTPRPSFWPSAFQAACPGPRWNFPARPPPLIQQYDEACEQLKAITEQKQQAENLLKQMLGEHESGTTGDHIVTWKNVTQERLDSKTLKAEHPALLQEVCQQEQLPALLRQRLYEHKEVLHHGQHKTEIPSCHQGSGLAGGPWPKENRPVLSRHRAATPPLTAAPWT